MEILRTNNLCKLYDSKLSSGEIISNVNLNIEEGEFIAIKGESGSGKTTLLNLLAGFLKPTKGEVFISNQCLNEMNESQKAIFRRENIGFIFQNYDLLQELTALENVMLPLLINGIKNKDAMIEAKKFISYIGLEKYISYIPKELSGGQQQRIAIARAIVNRPKIIFADEPTGNLDSKSKKIILEIFQNINRELGTTILMVTHSNQDIEYASKVITIKDGKIEWMKYYFI